MVTVVPEALYNLAQDLHESGMALIIAGTPSVPETGPLHPLIAEALQDLTHAVIDSGSATSLLSDELAGFVSDITGVDQNVAGSYNRAFGEHYPQGPLAPPLPLAPGMAPIDPSVVPNYPNLVPQQSTS